MEKIHHDLNDIHRINNRKYKLWVDSQKIAIDSMNKRNIMEQEQFIKSQQNDKLLFEMKQSKDAELFQHKQKTEQHILSAWNGFAHVLSKHKDEHKPLPEHVGGCHNCDNKINIPKPCESHKPKPEPKPQPKPCETHKPHPHPHPRPEHKPSHCSKSPICWVKKILFK
jgi:hypothetical protein